MVTREEAQSLITETIDEFFRLVMEPLHRNIREYDWRNNRVAHSMDDQYSRCSKVVRNLRTVSDSILDLDNFNMAQLLSLCKDISGLYELSVHEKMPNDTAVARQGITIENGMDSMEFVGFILGYEISDKLRKTKFVTTSLPDIGVSLPWNTIVLSHLPDSFQSGYNPEYDLNNRLGLTNAPTDIGRIGLEIHELWHQVQWKDHFFSSVGKLAITERIKVLFAGEDYTKLPYFLGDTVRNTNVFNSVQKLDDIKTFDGQAQFIGQWAADVYAYYSYFRRSQRQDLYWNDLYKRVHKEAMVIIRSGFNSRAANEIIAMNQTIKTVNQNVG